MADTLRGTTAVLGITSTLVLAGVNIGTSLLFVPRLSTLPMASSTAIFDRLYHDGAQVLVPLAGVGIASFGYLSYYYHQSAPVLASSHGSSSFSPVFGVAAGLVASTLLWTRTIIWPVNQRLIGMARDAERREMAGPNVVNEDLRRWRWMNYMRGFVALGAGVLALTALV